MRRSGQKPPTSSEVGNAESQRCLSPARSLHSSVCPSSPRNGGVDSTSRWRGGVRRGVSSKIPGKLLGKENKSGEGGQNLRGGGNSFRSRGTSRARILKPVQRPLPCFQGERQVPSNPQPSVSSQIKSTANKPSSNPASVSPNMISSRRVPDLHSRILSKIRAQKLKVKTKTEDCSPSPVPVEEVQRYLDSLFKHCDVYDTGSVRSSDLMRYLTSLVELPQLDKWRLDELDRLLDPRADNRYFHNS